MQRIFITGASGFLGSHLVKRFCDLGFDVVGGKRTTSDLWRLNHYREKVQLVDLDCPDSITDLFQDAGILTIIHTACAYGRGSGSELEVLKTNVELPLKLAHHASKHKDTVFINTDTFFSKPEFELGYMGAYVLSKRHCWEWLKLFRKEMKVVNMRLEHVYGPLDDRSKVVSWLCQEFMDGDNNNEAVSLSSCSQLRDFIYIDDVVSAYEKVVSAAASLNSGQTFEVGTGKTLKVQDMVNLLKKEFRSAGIDGPSPVFDEERDRPGEIMLSAANISTLESLGWVPSVSLSQGIEYLVKAELNGKR